MALPKPHNVETLQEFQSLKFSYDATNTHYFTGGTSTIVEGTPDVLYTDIAFIKPLSCIYTHAKLYPCPVLEFDSTPTASSDNLITSGNIKNALDNNQRVFYAVTETAGATAVKEFTIPNFPTETINGVKTPLKGTILIAQCTNADARSAQLKFKVNDGGEFSIWYSDNIYTSSNPSATVFGLVSRTYCFVFNGAYWCWVSQGLDTNTTYTAGTGLKLSSGTFSLNVPRVAKSANSLPGKNTAIIEEYSQGDAYDLPSSAYYHILTMEGTDTNYATQLALCMSGVCAYCRNYYNGVWQSWKRLDNPTMDSAPTSGHTSNVVSSDGIKTYVDSYINNLQSQITNLQSQVTNLKSQVTTLKSFHTAQITSAATFQSAVPGIATSIVFDFKKNQSTNGYTLIGHIDANNEIEVWGDSTEFLVLSDKFISAPTDCSYMFAFYADLTSLAFSNFDTSNATSFYSMFYGCESLTSLDLSNFNTTNVTNMDSMFDGCTALTSLDLSNFNTTNVTNMSGMFYSCRGLTTIIATNWSAAVQSGYMFYHCTSLVGGNGTVYDENHTDATYAHIDVAGNPGYFTAPSTT